MCCSEYCEVFICQVKVENADKQSTQAMTCIKTYPGFPNGELARKDRGGNFHQFDDFLIAGGELIGEESKVKVYSG